MPDAYQKAALRHWRDAEFLRADGRLANADQLYGLAAECAIKVALESVLGSISKQHKQHVDVLWNRARLQSTFKLFPTLYAFLQSSNPFNDWAIDQRYEDDSYITSERLNYHREMTKRLVSCIRSGKSR